MISLLSASSVAVTVRSNAPSVSPNDRLAISAFEPDSLNPEPSTFAVVVATTSSPVT